MVIKLPTSKIKSLSMGFVEIKGKVKEAEVLLKSPLNQMSCVYYNLHIEKWVRRGKNSSWQTIFNKTKKSLFYLIEDSEKILIDIQGAEINFKKDIDIKTGDFKSMPNYIKIFFEKEDIVKKSLGIKNKLRIREIYIKPNDELYIMGTIMKNNKLDSIKDSGNFKIGKSFNFPYFYISDFTEKEILSQLSWKIPFQIFCGGILTLFSFYNIILISIKNRLF